MKYTKISFLVLAIIVIAGLVLANCSSKKEKGIAGDAANKVYVAPGKYDEFYAFLSGGFSGQVAVYGIPSGRLLRVIPVFSVDPEKAWGFNEETKQMLETSHGFVPWDDSHHTELSMTDGVPDGKYLFINSNNTPRLAKIDLTTFRTTEIIEIPNSGGNHASPFLTENSEYAVGATRFSIPIPNADVPINTYKENFKGTFTFIKPNGDKPMEIAFQILVPGFNYDLAHAGKDKSHDWIFFSCYNTEQANTLLEVNASQNDKDYIAAVNWKKAEEYAKSGKGKIWNSKYIHNIYDESVHSAKSTMMDKVLMLDPKECPGMIYYLPTPKSPHGCDVDPTGEYIVGGGKLATVIPVMSFSKMLKAIEDKKIDKVIDGIPVLNYAAVLAGEVQKPGLGPLHTEFDGKGYAYTSMFISSEVVKWKLGTWEVVDRQPTYYSIGHLMIPGGDSKKPFGKYLLAMNKITKDRYLPTGPELAQSAQLFDITGEKMQMLSDFPTVGEPHYASALPAELVTKNQKKFFDLQKNNHPNVVRNEADTKIVRTGNKVDIYMTQIRSHFAPDNIEGIKLGDVVYFHVTNLEQDWDIPHGFSVKGANTTELLIMPGETQTMKWIPDEVGIIPFYCTDFCSALHQEMSGYLRVSPANSNVKLSWSIGK